MVKGIMIIMCIISLNGIAQQETYIRSGLIRSTMTFSPSFMLNNKTTNYYVTGLLEGYLNKYLSIRSEAHYLVGGKSPDLDPFFKNSIRASLGIQLHKPIGNFDSYIGFLPSFSVSQINADVDANGDHPFHFEPSFALKAGVTFYVWKFFNFFAEATYYNTTVRELDRIDGHADEFMISAGLGFNLNVLKRK